MAQRLSAGIVVDNQRLPPGQRHLLNVHVTLVTMGPGVRDVEVESINLPVVQQSVHYAPLENILPFITPALHAPIVLPAQQHSMRDQME